MGLSALGARHVSSEHRTVPGRGAIVAPAGLESSLPERFPCQPGAIAL